MFAKMSEGYSYFGQQLPVPEADNTHDRKAVVVYKDKPVVGFVPRHWRALLIVPGSRALVDNKGKEAILEQLNLRE